MHVFLLTAVTLAFFAANSLLARLALRNDAIDAASFTAIRIAAGAAALALLARVRSQPIDTKNRRGAIVLFLYAIAFSYAYRLLNASTGSLVLFAAVQLTMFGLGLARGERPRSAEWAGLALAFGGLVYLAFPGLAAPSTAGLLLMSTSGVAWGIYSLAARGVGSPVSINAGNFLLATPVALAALAAACLFGQPLGQPHASATGIALAATSGAVTSGLGYVIWYTALQKLKATSAAIVQLTVPVLAAIAGVVLLGEPLTARLVGATAAILGGIALAVLGRRFSIEAAAKSPPPAPE